MKTPEQIRDYVLKRYRGAMELWRDAMLENDIERMNRQSAYQALCSDILEFIGK